MYSHIHIRRNTVHVHNTMKNKNYYTVGTFSKSNIKIVERGKKRSIPLKQKYMTAHFLGTVRLYSRLSSYSI